MTLSYKLNKSELNRIKRQEKLYSQFLPVIKLKQEQLQVEQNRIAKAIVLAENQKAQAWQKLHPYIKLFPDIKGEKINNLLRIEKINTVPKSIAGVSIKTLSSIDFLEQELRFFAMAPWKIKALPFLKTFLHAEAHLYFLHEEERIIRQELRKATKKVNLFEQVLIPESKTAIKRIKVALGDEQVASVSRGKIAKKKSETKLLLVMESP